MKNLQTDQLKKKAREYYLSYKAELNLYDCGAELAEHLSTTLHATKLAFNNTMDKLAKIDPKTPKTRL